MSYQIDADYTQVFMFPPSLEDFVGPDDPVRFIRTFVDSLDIKAMGFKVRQTSDGRPGYAPSLLLKIWLFGSYERVHSSRRLERQCKRDIALMWLTGMNYPDHNTVWRFFHDNTVAIKKLFKQSVQVAIKNDLVGMVYHAIDGTKIGANASRFKGLNKEEMKVLLGRLDGYVEAMAHAVEENRGEEPDDRLPTLLQDAKTLQKKVQENVKELLEKQNGSLSLTDMDSRKMRTNKGNVEFSYNAQAGVDQKKGIIVGSEVSQEETDHHLLAGMLDEVKVTAGNNAKSSVADAGYFSGAEVAKIEDATVTTDVYVNIPVEHNRSADKASEDRYHTNNFAYDKERDVFICAHGWPLKRDRVNGDYVRYTCTHFKECPSKAACTKSKKEKRIEVHREHEAIRRHKQKIANESARTLLRQRGALIERVFGWVKEQYGLRRLRSCGLENAKAEWYLACTVYNLRKIWTCRGEQALFT
jgi:transposase